MRIVAGAHRGRPLVAPKGQSTRPTADRTRQALFNVFEHAPWSCALAGARVIDLFAGSGALGLEALSRGAAYCLFVDDAPDARSAIAANLRALGLEPRAGILAADAARLAPLAGSEAFDLAFLDPPYASRLTELALRRLADGGWLADGAVVAVERGESEPPHPAAGFTRLDQRRWGKARVEFLRFGQTA